MGVTDKVWEALTTVVRMNDKVVSLAVLVKDQQQKIENLAERVIRLEATVELSLCASQTKRLNG